MYGEVEVRAGRRPTDRELKEELNSLVRAKKLIYRKATSHKQAGYFPREVADIQDGADGEVQS